MKTIKVQPDPTFFESITLALEIDPGMALAVSLAAGIFIAGALATVALRRGWL